MPMEHGASASVCSDRCDVLLDTTSYFGYRRNKTTAAAWTSTGHAVEVSVVLADPPAISRCFVHCDGLTAEQFATETRVIRSEGAFLLLRMAFSPPTSVSLVNDVFVYKAGPGKPSLYLLPQPYPPPFYSRNIAILPSVGVDDGQFSVVAPVGRFSSDSVAYDLHIFSSKSKLFTTKQFPVSADTETYLRLVYHETSKVISLGGGSLGWVDLWQGILICDMLADEPVMSLMRFPDPKPSNKLDCSTGFDLPSARAIRDVTYSDGLVRFVEIEYRQNGNIKGCGGWVATMWHREVSAEDWSPCWKVDSSDISATSSCLPCLLPEMCDTNTKKLNLSNVTSTMPTLGLHNDGVMYMISKLKDEDPRTFVLVINTKSKTLEGITMVSSKIICIDQTILPCSFSNCISPIRETETAHPLECTLEKMESIETNLLEILDQLKDIESHLKFQDTTHSCILPFISSTIQFMTEHVSSAEQSDAFLCAVEEYTRLSADMKPSILSPIGSMKNSIRVTIDTLHNLLRTVGIDAESCVGLHNTAE